MSTDLLDRLSDKFTVSDGCWEWTANRDNYGYGKFHKDGKKRKAHRVLYELLVGPIAEGMDLDHLCSNRGCVRPGHLEPVTHRTNLMRGNTIVAAYAARTHCTKGHEYTPENTHIRHRAGKPVGRECRVCWRKS